MPPEGPPRARVRRVSVTGDLEPVTLQPPVQRAAAQAERLRRLADVAVVPGHRLLDQEALDFFEAHVLEAPAALAAGPQAEIDGSGPGLPTINATTDEKGSAEFAFDGSGFIALHVKHVVPGEGELDGKKFTETRYNATLVVETTGK